MGYFKLILTSFLILTFANIYAQKYRIERPKTFVFYFDKERIEIKNSEKNKLQSYSELIISNKKKLTHADLFFETGETISFYFNEFKCTQIEIEFMKRSLFIPPKKVKKILDINLLNVVLIWSGEKKYAFDSEYFYIQFSVGETETPFLQFFFNEQRFSEALIWKGVDGNSSQFKKL
jgi:hypothetical protein